MGAVRHHQSAGQKGLQSLSGSQGLQGHSIGRGYLLKTTDLGFACVKLGEPGHLGLNPPQLDHLLTGWALLDKHWPSCTLVSSL